MFLSERFRRVLFFLSVFLMPIEVWGTLPVKAVEVRIEGEVKVSSSRLVLGDVATIYARSLRDFEALSVMVLPQIPTGQREFSLSSDYIKQRVGETLGAGRDFAVHAPSDVRFIFQKPGVDAFDIAREILARGRESGKIPAWAEAEVIPAGGFDQISQLRAGTYRIEPGSELSQWRGETAFKILVPDGAGQKLFWIRAKIRWTAETWVANKEIRFQEPLAAASFRRAKVDVTGLREEPLPSTDEGLAQALRSARARRIIRENSALTQAMIDRRPDASAGQRMKVVFVSESGLRVSADGSLLGAAVIGSDARVRLNASRKIVSGRLVSENVMEVSL